MMSPTSESAPDHRRRPPRAFTRPAKCVVVVLAAVTLITIAACAGCATTVVPPTDVEDPATVYIADYGRHAGLIMPDENGGLIEFTYGDWAFYARERNSFLRGVWVLIVPTQATLGRQTYDPPRSPRALCRQLKAEALFPIEVESHRVRELRRDLRRRYDEQIDTEIYNDTYDRYFVHDEQSYTLLHNCNHRMVAWLDQLDCRSPGLTAVYSNWRITDEDGDTLDVAVRPDDPPQAASRSR